MKKYFLFVSFVFLLANSPAGGDMLEVKQEIAPEPATEKIDQEKQISKDFMVVSGHPLATKAGYKVLSKGGNAIDAAIAVQAVLNVVEPHSSGIGGGGFLLYYDAKDNKSVFYNGREKAPANIPENVFLDNNGNEKSLYEVLKGGSAVGVPGILKLLATAHSDKGKLPWFELFSDAIDVAALGYELSPRGHEVIKHAGHIREFPSANEMFLNENQEPKNIEEIIVNHALANTFRQIAINGIDDFYNGKVAEKIVSAVKNSPVNPGYMELQDLAEYNIAKGDLECLQYRKYKICSMPMPSGGITLLQILGILENFDLAQMDPDSMEAMHVVSEAIRLAFADRGKYSADDEFVKVPVKELLNKSYLKERSFLINVDAALIKVSPGNFSNLAIDEELISSSKKDEPPSTTHISIIDKEGNAVSFTSSIEHSFGSGLMVDGFLLNNQLTDFSFKKQIGEKVVANNVAGKKRPRSSMSPVFVFNETGNLELILGSPGGARIISYVLKTIIAVLDWKVPVDEAVQLPNFNKMFEKLEIEEGSYLVDYKEQLERIGHKVITRNLTSGIHAIHITQDGIVAGVDNRREGSALGK